MQLKALSGAARALAPGPTIAWTYRCAGAHHCLDLSLRRGPPLPGLNVAPRARCSTKHSTFESRTRVRASELQNVSEMEPFTNGSRAGASELQNASELEPFTAGSRAGAGELQSRDFARRYAQATAGALRVRRGGRRQWQPTRVLRRSK